MLLSSCQSSALQITGEDVGQRGFTSLQVQGSITLLLLRQLLRKAEAGHDSPHSDGRLARSSKAPHMPLLLVGLPSTMASAHAQANLHVYLYRWK